METMIGTIMTVGFNFAPKGWALCNGQILQIQANQALYALLGNIYGGDGKTTFALPDLRGRTIVGSQGVPKTGVTEVTRGQQTGVQSVSVTATAPAAVTIGVANLPKQITGSAQITGLKATSTLYATNSATGTTVPNLGAMLSSSGPGAASAGIYYTNPSPSTALPTVALNPASVLTAIDGTATFTSSQIGQATPQPLPVTATTTTTASVMQPSLGLTYIICTSGYFPSRN